MKNSPIQTARLLVMAFALQSIVPIFADVIPPHAIDPAMSNSTPVQSLNVSTTPLNQQSSLGSAAEQFESAGPLSSYTPPQPASTVSTAIQRSAYNTATLSILPGQPSLGSGPYASDKITQNQNSSDSYNFSYHLPQTDDYAYSLINVHGDLGSTFTIGLQGPADKQLKIELYDGYNHLSYFANLNGSLQNYTITIPADSDTFHSARIYQIALVVESEKSGTSGTIEVRTQGLLYNASISADSELHETDISIMKDTYHWMAISGNPAAAELVQSSDNLYRLSYQPNSGGWAAAIGSFDDFGTEEIETKNLTGMNDIIVGLASDNSQKIKFEIEDITGKKSVIYLEGVTNQEKFYRLTADQILRSNPLIDLSKIKCFLFVAEAAEMNAGAFQIRLGLQTATPLPNGWTRTASNSDFAYTIEKTNLSNRDIFTTRVKNLRSGQEYSFEAKSFSADTVNISQFSVDVSENSVYAKLIAPPQLGISSETYQILASGVTAYRLAPSNPQFAFGFRQNGIGTHYLVNLQTGETRDIAQESRYVQITPLDVSPNGLYVLWRHYFTPESNTTYLSEIGGARRNLGINATFYWYEFLQNGKLLITYDAVPYASYNPNYSKIKRTIELDTTATFDALQQKVVYEEYFSRSNLLIKTVKYEYGLTVSPSSPYTKAPPFNRETTTTYYGNGKTQKVLAQQINPETLVPFAFDLKNYYSNGVLERWAQGGYYADGKTVSAQLVATYNSRGKFTSRYAYYYNSKGKLIKKIRV